MFPFVPRKVSQNAKPKHAHSTPTSPPALPSTSPAPTPAASDAKGKGKQLASSSVHDADLAALLWLALSDHALWANTDLRRALASADDGWLPLSALRLPAPVHPPPPESAYVKAVRTHAAELLEVRMRVSAPSKAAWYGTDASGGNDDAGGYEVRRKDWRDALPRARNSSRAEWEARTVYMECIPLAHRALPAIYRFASSLLDPSAPENTLTTRVQAVSLPAHHLDRPGDAPKPKGFALVTFSSSADAAQLAADWPWLPRRAPEPATDGQGAHGEAQGEARRALVRDAARFGFRALPKARWDALNAEYLAYRQRLLADIARAESPDRGHTRAPTTVQLDQKPPPDADQSQDTPGDRGTPAAADRASLRPDAPFPPGCLLYVRNVHPETNKTTLRALFAAHAPSAAAALDYVDYSKGMSTCHIRLASPHYARALADAFRAHPLVQRQGLDGAGAPASVSDGRAEGDARAIEVEVVGGTREELYWSKVPEKVRRDAVRKALAQAAAAEGGGDAGQGAMAEEDAVAGEPGGKRKRKRKRKA